MIQIQSEPGTKIIELGGGNHPQIRPNVDVRAGDGVDYVANFEEPFPKEPWAQDGSWDGVFSHFVIEHISWRKVSQFVSEVFCILRPGGKAIFAT